MCSLTRKKNKSLLGSLYRQLIGIRLFKFNCYYLSGFVFLLLHLYFSNYFYSNAWEPQSSPKAFLSHRVKQNILLHYPNRHVSSVLLYHNRGRLPQTICTFKISSSKILPILLSIHCQPTKHHKYLQDNLHDQRTLMYFHSLHPYVGPDVRI